MGIEKRYIIGLSAVIIGVVSLIAISGIILTNQVIGKAEQRELNAYYEQILSDANLKAATAASYSALVANLPVVQKAMAENDRKTLADLFVPGFPVLKKEYGIRQFQFHKAPAISFFRVHKPEKFGDDLSGFRKTILQANTNKEQVVGPERGRAGLGLRGMVPIFNNGTHVGSVEFGLSFGKDFFQDFKTRTGIDAAFFVLPNKSIQGFDASDSGVKLLAQTQKRDLDFQVIKQAGALKNSVFLGEFDYEGTPFAALAGPIKDFSGNIAGVIYVASPTSMYSQERYTALASFVLIGLLAIIGGVLIGRRQGRQLTAPISALTKKMFQLANGEEAIELDEVKRPDEIGEMAQSVLVFRDNLIAKRELDEEKKVALLKSKEIRKKLIRKSSGKQKKKRPPECKPKNAGRKLMMP